MVTDRVVRKVRWAGWMLRYWVMDKYHEQLCHAALGLAVLIIVLTVWAMVHAAAVPPDGPRQAFVWWIWLIVMVVAAVVAYALMPKPQAPEPAKPETPVTKDGKSMRRIYGQVWTTDPAMLAWKNGTPEAIRKKGGKK